MAAAHLTEYESEQSVTWEDEDEKGTDPSNNTDDLADVWYKDGDEQRH